MNTILATYKIENMKENLYRKAITSLINNLKGCIKDTSNKLEKGMHEHAINILILLQEAIDEIEKEEKESKDGLLSKKI